MNCMAPKQKRDDPLCGEKPKVDHLGCQAFVYAPKDERKETKIQNLRSMFSWVMALLQKVTGYMIH